MKASPIIVRQERAGQFSVESLKRNEKYIIRVLLPARLDNNYLHKLILTFGDLVGSCIPEQFKVKIAIIEVTSNYRFIEAEINDFAWYPYSFEAVEKAVHKIKQTLGNLPTQRREEW